MIQAADPFSDEGGFGVAFAFDGDLPGELDAARNVLQGLQDGMRADAGAGRDRRGETDAIEAVVDGPLEFALDLKSLAEQMGQQG